MEIKSFDDILKLKDEFSRRLETRMKALERPGTGTIDEMIEEKRSMLKQSKARLDAAERTKAAMMKRADAELGRLKETLERLERDLEELIKARQDVGRPPAKRKKR